MAKILFISVCDKLALGARYIASFLEKHNHTCNFLYFKEYNQLQKKKINERIIGNWHEGIDPCGNEFIFSYPTKATQKEIELFNKLIEKYNPSLICFTLNTFYISYVAKLTKKIKEKVNIPIVWGGAGPTIQPEEAIKYCDIACIGEGEKAILDLVTALEKKQDYSKIKNLWIKNKNRIIKNKLRPLIRNIDNLPYPKFDSENWCINQNRLTKDASYNNFKKNYITIASRGCPFSCSYCCNSHYRALYKNQKYVRKRSVENVINELVEAKKKLNPKFIMFYDEVFLTDKRWLDKFVKLYKEKINLAFWCNIHPNLISKDILIKLRSCGLKKVTIGVQSGSKNICKNIYKRNTINKDIQNTAKLLKNLKIDYLIDIITNCPYEKKEDYKETIKLLLQLPKPFTLAIAKLSVFPNSLLKQNLQKDKPQTLSCEISNYYNKLYYLATSNWIPNEMTRFLFTNPSSIILNILFIPRKMSRKFKNIGKAILK